MLKYTNYTTLVVCFGFGFSVVLEFLSFPIGIMLKYTHYTTPPSTNYPNTQSLLVHKSPEHTPLTVIL